MAHSALTWGLVVATYKREHILSRCLDLAATQTRAPKEIIVVDASPNWEETRGKVERILSERHPKIVVKYVKARHASLPVQRNQGIDVATADVLFLIDDDSLMYPDCAEEVLRVYEADTNQVILGAAAISVPEPPDTEQARVEQQGTPAWKPKQTWLRRALKQLLRTEQTYFLPYDLSPPSHDMPAGVPPDLIGIISVMPGYAMTFRRSAFDKERFSEILELYAAGEDQDLSYRISRHGLVVNAVRARLCHLEISGGRLSKYQVTILAALNPAVLQQLYSPDRRSINRRWQRMLRRRTLIGLLKDLADRRWTLPSFRGSIRAQLLLGQIYSHTPEQLMEWYPSWQKRLLKRSTSER